jgi:hypothetical protein
VRRPRGAHPSGQHILEQDTVGWPDALRDQRSDVANRCLISNVIGVSDEVRRPRGAHPSGQRSLEQDTVGWPDALRDQRRDVANRCLISNVMVRASSKFYYESFCTATRSGAQGCGFEVQRLRQFCKPREGYVNVALVQYWRYICYPGRRVSLRWQTCEREGITTTENRQTPFP